MSSFLAPHAGSEHARCRIETLEPRSLLSVVTWDGGGDGISWHSAGNWSANQVPTSADDVIIPVSPTTTIRIGSTSFGPGSAAARSLTCGGAIEMIGNGILSIGSSSTIDGGLRMGGDQVGIYGDLTLGGASCWTSGQITTVNRRMILAETATFEIAGVENLLLNGTIESHGVTTWTQGLIRFSFGSFINAGVFTADSDTSLVASQPEQQPATFINTGTLVKKGTGYLQFDCPYSTPFPGVATFNNHGTVRIEEGVFYMNWFGDSQGFFDVRANGTLEFNRSHELVSHLAIQSTGHVRVISPAIVTLNRPDPQTPAVVRLTDLYLYGGNFDLRDNCLIADYEAASPGWVTMLLQMGYNNGNWNGYGGVITSLGNQTQYALGQAPARIALGIDGDETELFAGQTVDATTTLVSFTRYGDTNLDKVVDITDLGSLASTWQLSGDWSRGDANYDAKVDITDLGLLASNWQQTVVTAQPTAEVAVWGFNPPVRRIERIRNAILNEI